MGKRTTYANVVSTVALALALGGTAHAAGQVTSADIVNGTIQLKDISKAARQDLLPWVAQNGDSDFGSISGDSAATVAEMNLDTGMYFMSGKLWLRNDAAATNVVCQLTTGTEAPYIFTDIVWGSLTSSGSAGSTYPMSFEVVAWMQSDGPVTLVCNPKGGTVHVFDVKLTAVPVEGFSVNYY